MCKLVGTRRSHGVRKDLWNSSARHSKSQVETRGPESVVVIVLGVSVVGILGADGKGDCCWDGDVETRKLKQEGGTGRLANPVTSAAPYRAGFLLLPSSRYRYLAKIQDLVL